MNDLKYLFLSMRPHQWAKGVFIFCPLIFGQKLLNQSALLNTFFMFLVFSLAASAMYLFNDILDVDEDKNHPEKRNRPLASGNITVTQAKSMASLLVLIVIPAAFLIDIKAGALILFYLAFNYVYTRYLKHAVILDVFCIGAFFYLRILAGSIASDVVLSDWIIICGSLLALFLGLNKRKYDIEYSKESRPVFARYDEHFIDRMISIISACLIMAYSLYVMDPITIGRFGTRNLFFTMPFVYYGVIRYIYLIDTKWFGGDPARTFFGDFKIKLTMILWFLVCVGVIYFRNVI